MRASRFWSVALASLALPIAATAQSIPPEGTFVRIVSPEIVDWVATGQLAEVTNAYLRIITPAGRSIRVTPGSLESIEANVGEGNAATRGVLIGAIMGLAAGEIIDEETAEDSRTSAGRTRVFWLSGIAVGGLMGAYIGSQFPTIRWARVTPELFGSFGPQPGAGLAFRLHF